MIDFLVEAQICFEESNTGMKMMAVDVCYITAQSDYKIAALLLAILRLQ
jgi:hypothetical protein